MNKAIYMETILNAEEIAASVTASASDHPLSPSATPQTLEEKWEKAGIGNAFIFGKVMSTNTDLLLELLQLSLPELEIREISDAVQEVYLKTSIDAHGVRLDISVRDSRNRIFDVEMQLRDEKNIPRRIRQGHSECQRICRQDLTVFEGFFRSGLGPAAACRFRWLLR